ncbi:MMPL family transporter [Planctomonas psychrotolerans]|uniref:MMPL family transporter n=1 Tax=Planctomonas psychrotolerans TaxID=2528712 RepID=UPI001238925C|nr:MMPL family transporter [Planctomonas psychrotolerans]
MAHSLFRLGTLAYRHSWRVLSAWLLLLALFIGGGLALGGATEESFAIPGTESQEALDRLSAVFPQAAGASAQMVFIAPDGESVRDEGNSAAIEESIAAAGEVGAVEQALSPFSEYASDAVSDNDAVAIGQVQFDGQADDVSEADIEAVQDAAEAAESAGMTVEFGGQVFQDLEYGLTVTELIGVAFAALVLVITFGSLVSAGMPLITAIAGIGVVMGGVLAVAAVMPVSSASPLLAVMIGLAVGIDYALFILVRHRNQLARGMDPAESAATAVATAGSAVVFAGVTVIIALLGLLVVGIPFLSVMGVAAAFAVLSAMLAALTLLPAMLGLAGARLAPKVGSRAYRRAHPAAGSRSAGERWVRIVLKAPIVFVLAVVAIAGALVVPAFSLQLALPSGASEPEGSTARAAYDTISENFGPGYNGPLILLVDITQTTDPIGDLDGIADELRDLEDVAFVGTPTPNPSVDTAIIQVLPESGPDAPETAALVERIRDLAPGIEDEYDTAIAVTGATAIQTDISTRLNNALIPFGVVVVGLSIVLLMIVFRSVFVPIKAAVGFLLSVVVSFGVVVTIFQDGFLAEALHVTPGPILSFMPILLMAILFGLAMDYEVFLVSGMREHFVHTGDARGAIVQGFAGAARVVTAAALIMFFVFAAFVPEGAGVIKTIALGLAVGIFFDAFLVRMTLVPAAMALARRGAWWLPKWLGRILPNTDIEGENLGVHREAARWAETQGDSVVTADALVVGAGGSSVGPLTLRVPRGSTVLVSGHSADRRALAATLAGRLDPVSGRLQVAGYPLPSEASAAMRAVAMVDAGRLSSTDASLSVGAMLGERLTLARGLRRPAARSTLRDEVARINAALAMAGSRNVVSARTGVAELAPLPRAVVLAAVAAVEGTPVLLIDSADAFPAPGESDGFLTAVRALVDDGTTIILGRATPPGAGTASDALHVDLTTLAPASEPDAAVVLEGTR